MMMMTPEAWAALVAVLTPLIASAVSNVALRRDVKGMRTELAAFCRAMKEELDHVKKRVTALEAAAKPARKRKR